ncbi:MAG: DUF692 domain-containing protein [Pseudomonadales bacterium]|nr:DUF692 domain-containing protein [Pseudomonadales bacterium]
MAEPVWRERAALAGLGLRREIAQQLLAAPAGAFDFIELAPENWIGVGGKFANTLRAFSERYPITLHGLSLNIGGFAPLDTELLDSIAGFIRQHHCKLYSEHLSYCADHGHLYDLMPIPFRRDAVGYLAERVQRVQDAIGQRLVLENVSYYAAPEPEMSELEFICEILERADCELLLDVNNIYVNSINQRYDPIEFMQGLPADRVRYMHIAGHYVEAEDLRVDTHGAAVLDEVWALLAKAYALFGVVPTLLERDFNFPPMAQLFAEVQRIRDTQHQHQTGAGKLA